MLHEYDEDGAVRFEIFRGITRIWPLSPKTDVPGQCQNANNKNAPELFNQVSGGLMNNDIQTPSHVIYLDPVSKSHTILQKDQVLVSGSTDGVVDGLYVLVNDSIGHGGLDPDLNYTKLYVRYLGAKKPGDSGEDNSGVIRMGPRR